LAVSPNPPELRYDRVDVFPHGGLIYITDDVLDQKPQLALSIFKRFFAKIEQLRSVNGPTSPWLEVHDACLLWRLCVRPELMESLYQKCEENSAELAAQNPDDLRCQCYLRLSTDHSTSRAELYQLLTSTNYVDQDHPIEPLSLVQDKYPILSERRVIAEHPPLDYFNRAANSQEDANTHMVGYYAAMQSVDLRRTYRHFYVVHTEPEADCAIEWNASIHNIAGIITPEQCIEELSKPSKESMFDFLDWAMKPKERPSAVEPEQEEMGDAPMEMSSPAKEISTGLVAH
jgi:chromo domain-containing protein 1